MTQQWKRPSRNVRKLYPDARRESQSFVLTGGGPKRLGCVYTLIERASGASWEFRTLKEVYTHVDALTPTAGEHTHTPRFRIARAGTTVTLMDTRSGYRRNYLTVDEARDAAREILKSEASA